MLSIGSDSGPDSGSGSGSGPDSGSGSDFLSLWTTLIICSELKIYKFLYEFLQIQFYGHKHVYERSYPIYDNHVYNSSKAEIYTNAKAPIQIISGAGVRGHYY
jgi:hypothetical protein